MLIVLTLICFQARSDVVETSAHGFTLKIERSVPVSADVAYQQFLDIGKWWSEEHTWFGKASGLYIEPQAGGCFCEKNGEKSALHMIVSYVDPGREIRLIGGLGPLQRMALDGAMSFKFIPVDDDSSTDNKVTNIVFEYKVSGHSSLESLAGIVNAVQTMQIERLQASLQN